jgi:hypothetical protein
LGLAEKESLEFQALFWLAFAAGHSDINIRMDLLRICSLMVFLSPCLYFAGAFFQAGLLPMMHVL